VVLLILESLGSTELLFILVMALVFFGPRKLPQISRSLGKNLAEFRRASEDFKATWNREVSLEEFNMNSTVDHVAAPKENSLAGTETLGESPQSPSIGAVTPDGVVPHQPAKSDAPGSPPDIALSSGDIDSEVVTDQVEPSRKRDWL
jgi:sec-independent protein translocase protein TatB